MKKFKLCLIGIMLVGIGLMPFSEEIMDAVKDTKSPMVIIVDSGHGGMDSGATGRDGTRESDITLKIGKKIKTSAEKYGISVVMTREDEGGLSQNGEKWSKIGDMRERKRIITETPADMVLSIHLNSFEQDKRVQGAQVFYPKEVSGTLKDKNEEIAESIQKVLNENINTRKERAVLPRDKLYLFRDAQVPMILVECGFLSNEDDLRDLKDEKFQQKIAENIVAGICDVYKITAEK